MNSTLESYPFLKNRLSNFDFSYTTELQNTKASEIASDSLNIDVSNINVTTTEPLVTLVQNACELVEKAKKTGDNKDIVEVEKAISLIYEDYCRKELEYELKNLKKSLELPAMVAELEGMFEQKQDKDTLLKEASKGIREAVGLLKFYPEIDRKADLKMKLDGLEEKLKGVYTYQDIEQMITLLQEEVKNIEGNASQPESFINGLYEFKNHFKLVSSILSQSLLNRQEKKDLKDRMKEIAQNDMAFDEQFKKILNDQLDQSIVPSILRLINEVEYNDVISSENFAKFFVAAKKDSFFDSLADWKQAINETVGMYLINHATNHEQLNKGILFFEYVPYIDLGKERLEICEQFFTQRQEEIKGYQSIDDVVAIIQPTIDERNNNVQRVNEASTPSEMLEILKNTFHEKALEINEIKSKYVWLRKELRAYSSLNQIVRDIENADEEKFAIMLKNNNALEIHGNDDKYSFVAAVKGSSDTIILLD